jgi:hypothetical protein
MKVFSCSACGKAVFFDNVRCTNCGRGLAFLPDLGVMSAIESTEGKDAGKAPPSGKAAGTAAAGKERPATGTAAAGKEPPASTKTPAGGDFVVTASAAKGARYRLCRNGTEFGACNWAVPIADDDPFCRACRLNEIIPNLSKPHSLEAWQRVERAKRRCIYTLFELGLKVESKAEKPDGGLAFSLKEDTAGEKVMTGHDNGLITLNLAEADNPFRERLREQMGEAYRTLLGHFRHEIGHYYWDVLIKDSPDIDAFRAEFGDERESYDEALKRHYKKGAPPDWQQQFVSMYASMHPWEDWAESWAHYLHMVDTLGTARSYGLALQPEVAGRPSVARSMKLATRRLDFDDFDDLIAGWVPLTLAMNSLNRSMGLPDIYPFVLSDKATHKLRFVHDVIEKVARGN